MSPRALAIALVASVAVNLFAVATGVTLLVGQSRAEARLEECFPGLSIDLAHALGTQCPGKPRAPCPAQRPLTLAEIAKGWAPGDSNSYTTRCVHCGAVFVPRFSVSCAAPDWVGSEGPGTALWCEMLPPWTLRKELTAMVLGGGVGALTSRECRDASKRPELAVVFWNALLAWRVKGLPFAFMLADADISAAFPPNEASGQGAGSTPTK